MSFRVTLVTLLVSSFKLYSYIHIGDGKVNILHTQLAHMQ